jgi:hypothetical protein
MRSSVGSWTFGNAFVEQAFTRSLSEARTVLSRKTKPRVSDVGPRIGEVQTPLNNVVISRLFTANSVTEGSQG